ncbi:MAG: YitT family protein [Clostridia bacterium]|nr:YitT family protein [Clostridia bacterium]
MTLLKSYFKSVTGAVTAAAGVAFFLAPNSIASGGASGLGIVLYSGFSVPVSFTVIAVNFLLFLIGYKLLERNTMIKTAFSTIVLAVFIEIFSHFPAVTDDVFLSSVFGGLLLGLGTGFVISSGSSTGGSDFAAVLIRKKFHHIPISVLILIIDFSVVLLSVFYSKDYTLVLYSVLGLFITSKAVDFVVEGLNFSKLVYIISDENKMISEFIISNLNRGVTSLYANGVYSDSDKSVLMCAVSSRQFPQLKNYVLTKDKNAFIILSEARSVYGKGFKME